MILGKIMKQASNILLAILAGLAIGFFAGRTTMETKVITKFEKGNMISGYVSPEKFDLISEEKPDTPLLPVIIYRDNYQPVDSAAFAAMVIADHELKRKYSVLAFDDKEKGRLELFPTIQYNRLAGLEYNFTPVIEKNYIYKEKVWQPFVSMSYSTLDYVGFGGGIFYHKLGFEYQYNINIRKKPVGLPTVDDYFRRGNYHWLSGKYMF